MTDSPAALLEEATKVIDGAVRSVGGSGGRRKCHYCLRSSFPGQPEHHDRCEVHLLRALVAVLQQQQDQERQEDTRVDSSSSTNSPAVTTAGKDTVVPPTVSDNQPHNEPES